jgi:hypothetical protein
MLQETEHHLGDPDPQDDLELRSTPAAPVIGTLPAGITLSQRAAAMLRAYLEEARLGHYRIFHCPPHDLYDIELSLKQLDEPGACWETMPALVRDGQEISTITHEDESSKIWDAGVLRLARHEVVLARWYWVDVEGNGALRALWLAGAPSAKVFHQLRTVVADYRRQNAASFWQIVRGYAGCDGPRIARKPCDNLLLEDEIRNRIERELIGFFAPEVAQMYRALDVPYRRGALLHGPPGNGKTSLIRHLGHRLPKVPAMLLRPSADFDSGDLEEVIRRWSQQAPAILVIEDLNWLLKQVNVSTFLNLLDGVDSAVSGGLLLIATSNYPEQLDPAINNRPGRFDVVVEIPCPSQALRLAFLRSALAECPAGTIDRLAEDTHGLSFAHLQEILRLSGLEAIHAGRHLRSEQDVLSAARTVIQTYHHASSGFPIKPEMPFGLLPLRNRRARS